MAMTYRRQSYELRPGTYFNYPREYGSTGYSGFGSPPAGMPDVTALVAQDINIAANTQYTFVFSSLWTTQSGLQAALNNDFTPDIATNVMVTTQGMEQITITLVPTSTEPVSTWLERFQAEGLTNLISFWAGSPQTPGEVQSMETNVSTVVPVLVTSIEQLPQTLAQEAGSAVKFVATTAGQAAGGVASGLASGLGAPLTIGLLAAGIFLLYQFAKPYIPGRGDK